VPVLRVTTTGWLLPREPFGAIGEGLNAYTGTPDVVDALGQLVLPVAVTVPAVSWN
jgi:hypothetical protein